VQWFEEHIRPLVKQELRNNNFRPIKVHLSLESPLIAQKNRKLLSSLLPLLYSRCRRPDNAAASFVPGEVNRVIYEFFCEMVSGKQPLAAFNPIYLWGPSGSGKTHLLSALYHALKKQGLNVLYANADTFTEHVVSAIRGGEMQDFRKAYRHVEVLLIDNVHLFARKNATQEEFFSHL